MRILWFCNTPGLAKEYLTNTFYGGGWIDALQGEIEEDGKHELGLVFYSNEDLEPFSYGKTKYFPVKRLLANKWKRFVYRWNASVEYDESLEAFVDVINTYKPDVINVFGTENPFGLIVKRVTDIPIAVAIQGNLTAYSFKFFSGITHFSQLKSLSWMERKNIMINYALFKSMAKVEREILNNTSYVMGRTDWDRRICRILAPNATYLHVNEIIRPSFYKSRWKFKQKESFTCFTTTGVNIYKGFETIVNAAIELTQNNFQFKWKVAGIKEDDVLAKIALKARGIKKPGDINIQLVGVLPESGLIEHMLQSDAYVQVSHIENSPNSLFEAMLLGMPVIASHAGGSGSIIENNVTGWLIQDGDPISLAGAILEMADDPARMQEFGNRSYTTAHALIEPKKVYQSLIDAYSLMIKQKH